MCYPRNLSLIIDHRVLTTLSTRRLFIYQVEKVRDEMKTAGMRPSEEFLDSPDTIGNCALDINSVQRVTEVWPAFLVCNYFLVLGRKKKRMTSWRVREVASASANADRSRSLNSTAGTTELGPSDHSPTRTTVPLVFGYLFFFLSRLPFPEICYLLSMTEKPFLPIWKNVWHDRVRFRRYRPRVREKTVKRTVRRMAECSFPFASRGTVRLLVLSLRHSKRGLAKIRVGRQDNRWRYREKRSRRDKDRRTGSFFYNEFHDTWPLREFFHRPHSEKKRRKKQKKNYLSVSRVHLFRSPCWDFCFLAERKGFDSPASGTDDGARGEKGINIPHGLHHSPSLQG